MELQAHLAERRRWVDEFLRERLKSYPDLLAGELLEAMEYALEGGKRIRAVLVMEAAELCGEKPESVLPTAAAIECFHAYSLVHDDLPAMDNDVERRGQPTVHVRFGEAMAILVGDSLIPLGFELLSCDQLKYSPAERVLPVIGLFSGALGWRGLTGGQFLDLSPVRKGKLWPEIHRRKTAILFEASLAAGAILAGMDTDQLEKLKQFGVQLGLAYQLMDDALDWDAATEDRLFRREEAQRQARAQTQEALASLEVFGTRAERLRQLAEYLANRRL